LITSVLVLPEHRDALLENVGTLGNGFIIPTNNSNDYTANLIAPPQHECAYAGAEECVNSAARGLRTPLENVHIFSCIFCKGTRGQPTGRRESGRRQGIHGLNGHAVLLSCCDELNVGFRFYQRHFYTHVGSQASASLVIIGTGGEIDATRRRAISDAPTAPTSHWLATPPEIVRSTQ